MDKILNKLQILADAAKYDVSCSSSGSTRKNNGKGIGNAADCGICHTWTADGRCVSLLKILMTNHCVYDCHYCVNRLTNDVPRATFTPKEVADLTIAFYKRNYIEGLFLSSAIVKSPDYTMERMVEILSILRNQYHFSGYVHVKAIPDASIDLVRQAGYLADRLSLNIELPTQSSLSEWAPQKKMSNLLSPIAQVGQHISNNVIERKSSKNAPAFVPAGQSTQLIVGATKDTDFHYLKAAKALYNRYEMKRVFYSAYVPVSKSKNDLALFTVPPLKREHRLYQADWLMRFYKFDADELVSIGQPNLSMEMDPKAQWAVNHMDQFPVEVNQADYHTLLRVPGIGPISAGRIIRQRKFSRVTHDGLKKMGVVMKRAKYFITCSGEYKGGLDIDSSRIRYKLSDMENSQQLSFWGD